MVNNKENKYGTVTSGADHVLPVWLVQPEQYVPRSDKDTFIEKSINAILQLMKKLNLMDGAVQALPGHPLVKLFHAIIISVLVVMSYRMSFLYLPLAWVLVQLTFLQPRQLRTVLKVSLLAIVLNGLALLPAILFMNQTNMPIILVKLFITLSQMQLFALTTKWHDVIAALRMLRVPSIFIFILHTTLKYVYILGKLTLALLYALKLRSVGVNKHKGMHLGGVMGTLFIRSTEEATALYNAMICRCFDGTFRGGLSQNKLQWQDGFVVGVLLFLMYAFYMGGR